MGGRDLESQVWFCGLVRVDKSHSVADLRPVPS